MVGIVDLLITGNCDDDDTGSNPCDDTDDEGNLTTDGGSQ